MYHYVYEKSACMCSNGSNLQLVSKMWCCGEKVVCRLDRVGSSSISDKNGCLESLERHGYRRH